MDEHGAGVLVEAPADAETERVDPLDRGRADLEHAPAAGGNRSRDFGAVVLADRRQRNPDHGAVAAVDDRRPTASVDDCG